MGPATPAVLKKPVGNGTGQGAISAVERMRMLVQARLENAHEKEKTKREIREEEQEEAKRERQREWRLQVFPPFGVRFKYSLSITAAETKRAGSHFS